jgi:glyoxylase I family protein
MADPPLEIRGFSHVCVRVSDLERSLAFYRDGLGLRVIFDPGSSVTVELLQLPAPAEPQRRSRQATGYTNISLAVSDLDAAYRALEGRGLRPLQRPVEVGGVRMFFLADPDGTPVELIEFPGGALSSAEHNGVRVPGE